MRKALASLVPVLLLLTACSTVLGPAQRREIAWGPGSFDSNGERIYFTATNDRGERISYRGGPQIGMMMMGDVYACVSCHGTDARGGRHVMHMQVMDAPDIRWSALVAHEDEHEEEEPAHEDEHGEYDLKTFRLGVVEGRHPDGEAMSDDMPRWRLEQQDLADLAEYLQSLP